MSFKLKSIYSLGYSSIVKKNTQRSIKTVLFLQIRAGSAEHISAIVGIQGLSAYQTAESLYEGKICPADWTK
jgi:hypothetical protein